MCVVSYLAEVGTRLPSGQWAVDSSSTVSSKIRWGSLRVS